MKFNNIVSYSLNNYYWLLFEKKTIVKLTRPSIAYPFLLFIIHVNSI